MMLRRYLTILLCLGVFVVCLGWLRAIEETKAFLTTNVSFSLLDGKVTLREHWMGKYLNGQKTGFTEIQIRQDPKGKTGNFQTVSKSRFKLTMLGQEVDFYQEVEATVAADLTLERLTSTFKAPQMDETTMEARVAGNVLEVTSISHGQPSFKEIPLDGDLYNLEALYPLIARKQRKPGDVLKKQIFEPMLGGIQDVSISIVGPRTVQRTHPSTNRVEEIPTTLVEMSLLGTTQRSWLDAEGNPVVEETMMGGLSMVGVEEAKATATNMQRNTLRQWDYGSNLPAPRPLEDLFLETLIPSNVQFPHAAEVFSATFALTPLSPDQVDYRGVRQNVLRFDKEGETLRLAVHSASWDELAATSHTGYALGDDLSELFPEATEPTLRIQSTQPKIIDTARKIVGDTTDAHAAALKLFQWLSSEANIHKEMRPSIPDALEVLESRRGDCNEHAILFAALGRSIGLPTKMVTGIVYSPDLGQFGYHAWNEVLLSVEPEIWYPLDATLDQSRVDATHIKFGEGEVDQQLKIIPLIGKLKVHVEAYD